MTNRKYLYCLYMICIAILFGCNHNKYEDFTVFYYCGDIEPFCRIDGSELDSLCWTVEYDDTVFIDSYIAEQIKNAVTNAKPSDEELIQSAFMYVNIGNSNLCISGTDNKCWIKQPDKRYHPAELSNWIVYLLKSKSKYYNYLRPDILKYDTGLQQFGIPAGYAYYYENRIEKYHPAEPSNWIVSFLRSKSRYYNYLQPDVLKYDTGPQQFGIPADYSYENRTDDDIRLKESSKVLIRVKN